MVDIARKLNPDIEIVLRSDTEDGAALLRGEKLGEGVLGPLPHAKPTFKWKSAAPWIVIGAIGIGATIYYTRRTVARRRAGRAGGA